MINGYKYKDKEKLIIIPYKRRKIATFSGNPPQP